MNKKKWALIVLCVLIGFGYYKLFYKTFSEKVVAKSADNIVAIDVKRITNTVLWSIIKHPSKWKMPSFSKTKSDAVDWKDIIEIPDYVFLFHTKEQAQNAWYTVLKIKDEASFLKGITQYHFEKLDSNVFINKDLGIQALKNADYLLLSTNVVESALIHKIAAELFVQKSCIARNDLDKVINAKSHVALKFVANNFLAEDAIATANFNEEQLEVEGNFLPKSNYTFSENNFDIATSSLLNIGFTQPSTNVYALLSDSSKANITKAININVDSLFLPSNKYYALDIAGIQPRVDSAITYTYDDDFNKVEKVVVNNVDEPMINFLIAGDSVNRIYNNWVASKKIEVSEKGNLFTPIPFVKTYCQHTNDKMLSLKSNNYISTTTDLHKSCILYANVSVAKAPSSLLKFLPNNILSIVEKIETVKLAATKNNKAILFNAQFKFKGTIF
jgi:hypothetical protein